MKDGCVYFVADMLFVLMDEIPRVGINPVAYLLDSCSPSGNFGRWAHLHQRSVCGNQREPVADSVLSRILGVSLS